MFTKRSLTETFNI